MMGYALTVSPTVVVPERFFTCFLGQETTVEVETLDVIYYDARSDLFHLLRGGYRTYCVLKGEKADGWKVPNMTLERAEQYVSQLASKWGKTAVRNPIKSVGQSPGRYWMLD